MASPHTVIPPIGTHSGSRLPGSLRGSSNADADAPFPERPASESNISMPGTPSYKSASPLLSAGQRSGTANSLTSRSSGAVQNTRRISFSHNPVAAKLAHQQRELERIGQCSPFFDSCSLVTYTFNIFWVQSYDAKYTEKNE